LSPAAIVNGSTSALSARADAISDTGLLK
jgi:hypothetical protein